MLPAFDEFGSLQAGIHRVSIERRVPTFRRRLIERKIEGQELVEFAAWARRVGGTAARGQWQLRGRGDGPNDVDLIILPGPDYPRDQPAATDEEVRWPFLQVLVAADDDDLERWATHDFGTDRDQRPKGVVEVIL